MKAVLISIRPKWCRLIFTGEKTLEVRKTKPKIEIPFKVYIYCTEGVGRNTFNVPVSAEQIARHYAETGSMECLNCPIGNGKVIGEFVCDAIVPISVKYFNPNSHLAVRPFPLTCLTDKQIIDYLGNGVRGFGWHISNLKIYEKPKELSEFYFPPEKFCEKGLCGGCPGDYVSSEYGDVMFDCEWKRPLKRPPQSWCYVMELP